MLKKLNKSNQGFTIIEVLIVLAIAALILLIVFLAVPALQRNSRNTQIKNDVAGVLGGVAEFQGANSGAMPDDITGSDGTVTYTRSGGTDTTAKINGSTTVATDGGDPGDTGTINVEVGTTCDGVASSRAVAARYLIETSSETLPQCQDS